MKQILLFFLISFILFASCKKNEPNSTYIEGSMFIKDVEKGHANIEMVAVDQEPQSISGSGICFSEELSQGGEVWFEFNVTQGEIYSIWWEDSWFEEYTAGSIYVTAFKDNQFSTYFPKERIIQMIGGPRAIVANETGTVYIKVTGFTGEVDGTFAVHADPIPISDVLPVEIDSTNIFSIKPGEVKICSIPVFADSTYSVLAKGSLTSFPYGSGCEVMMGIVPSNIHEPYVYNEPVYCAELGSPDTLRSFTSNYTGEVYIMFFGAYWWEERQVTLNVSK